MARQDYLFNAVTGSKDEVAFKKSISEAVLEHDFMPSYNSSFHPSLFLVMLQIALNDG